MLRYRKTYSNMVASDNCVDLKSKALDLLTLHRTE